MKPIIRKSTNSIFKRPDCFDLPGSKYMYNDGTPAHFDSFCDELHDYVNENGYSNLDKWVESAARKKGK